jgi:integrase
MTYDTQYLARTHAPLEKSAAAQRHDDHAATGLTAAALAERMASKVARLQRRHTLAEVVRQYVANGGEVLDRDPGRLTPLHMWVQVLGERPMDDITGEEVAEVLAMYSELPVQRYVGRDRATGARLYRAHGKRSASTVNRAKVILSSVFSYAKDNALLSLGHPSPTRDIRGKGFNAAELPDRSLSNEQVETLLAYARTAPWKKMYLYVLMALTTGARRGELLQLRGRHLVLDVDDPHAIVGLRRREDERAGTKNGAVKVMPLVPKVVAEISRWGVPDDEDLLFPSSRVPGQPFEVNAAYARLVRKLGFENKRLHDLRHTAGTMFANDGKSESQIAALLGHKTLTMVPRYTRVQPHAKTAAVRSSTLWALK